MKKKSLLILIVALIAVMTVTLTACGGPKTLEEFFGKTDITEEEGMPQEEGLTIEVQGNDVIYTYDVSVLGYSAEQIKQPAVVEALENAIDTSLSTYEGLCKDLEEETDITGVQMILNYTFGDEVIVTRTITAPAE